MGEEEMEGRAKPHTLKKVWKPVGLRESYTWTDPDGAAAGADRAQGGEGGELKTAQSSRRVGESGPHCVISHLPRDWRSR